MKDSRCEGFEDAGGQLGFVRCELKSESVFWTFDQRADGGLIVGALGGWREP